MMPMAADAPFTLGPSVSWPEGAPVPAWSDNLKLPPFFAPHAIFARAAAAQQVSHYDLQAAVLSAEPNLPAAAIADKLERIAQSLRGATPAQLATMGRNTNDPLELLILGFALGATSRSVTQEPVRLVP